MTDTLISFETAKLAKDKGYNSKVIKITYAGDVTLTGKHITKTNRLMVKDTYEETLENALYKRLLMIEL